MGSVSFVIPVFNKAKFLKYVIESLKQQSGKFEREFIFIDDGSTDNSYKMILDLTKNLKNTRIIKQKNKGSANATNVGIKLAKMKYVKFLDADDIILSDATISLLKILASFLQKKLKNTLGWNYFKFLISLLILKQFLFTRLN